MGITTILEVETGEGLMQLPDPTSFTNVIIAIAGKDTIHLGAIDEYGITVFNRLQLPQLILELEKAKDTINEKSLEDLHRHHITSAESVNSPPAVITVLKEYARLRSYKDVLSHLQGILRMAREALNQPHQYLRFDGD